MDLYGKWRIEVASKDASFDQRLTVTGATNGDGIYAGIPGTVFQVEGDKWLLSFEWNDNNGSDWQRSDEKVIAARYLFDQGLVLEIGVDDNLPELRDHDFDDVVVRCVNLDPDVNPFIPIVNTADFTIGGDRRPRRPDRIHMRPRPDRRPVPRPVSPG